MGKTAFELAASMPIKRGCQVRNGFVLGMFGDQLWIGVRSGNDWKPARPARAGEETYFSGKPKRPATPQERK